MEEGAPAKTQGVLPLLLSIGMRRFFDSGYRSFFPGQHLSHSRGHSTLFPPRTGTSMDDGHMAIRRAKVFGTTPPRPLFRVKNKPRQPTFLDITPPPTGKRGPHLRQGSADVFVLTAEVYTVAFPGQHMFDWRGFSSHYRWRRAYRRGSTFSAELFLNGGGRGLPP